MTAIVSILYFEGIDKSAMWTEIAEREVGRMPHPTGQLILEFAQLLTVAMLAAFAQHAYMASEQPKQEEMTAMIEAEDLEAATPPGIVAQSQSTRKFFHGRWSSDKHLYVNTNAIGQTIRVQLPKIPEGTYDVLGFFTQAVDYGIIQNYLNDVPLGDPVDLYSVDREVRGTGRILLGRATIGPGQTTWTIAVLGANRSARMPKFQMGIDGIVFVPVRDRR